MKVPEWLDHLQRDDKGRAVPYINRYGTEAEATYRVDYDPHVDDRAVFLDDVEGAPADFTRQHLGRQRECVTKGLCQVCARAIPWSRRFLVVAALSTDFVDLDWRTRVAAGIPPGVGKVATITEPWLCERCARFAVRVCPALIRRTREDALVLVPVRSKREVTLIASAGYVDTLPETKENPAVMWAKIILPQLAVRRAVPA